MSMPGPEILSFSSRTRRIMDENGIDMWWGSSGQHDGARLSGGRSIRKRTVGKWSRIALPRSLATAPGQCGEIRPESSTCRVPVRWGAAGINERPVPEKAVAPPAGLGARVDRYRCCLPALAGFST